MITLRIASIDILGLDHLTIFVQNIYSEHTYRDTQNTYRCAYIYYVYLFVCMYVCIYTFVHTYKMYLCASVCHSLYILDTFKGAHRFAPASCTGLRAAWEKERQRESLPMFNMFHIAGKTIINHPPNHHE